MKSLGRGLLAAALCALAGCAPRELPPGTLPWSASDLRVLRSMTPLPDLTPSPTNPVADHPGAATLGHRLFFDPRLSADGKVSCATCHQPERGFTDGLALAKGMKELARNTPTTVGLTRAPFLMWDGRKDTLWSQALSPLFGADEMGGTPESVARVVREHYASEYAQVFGSGRLETAGDVEVCVDVGRALEAYQRKLVHREAPFDRFVEELLAGDPEGGLHMTRTAVRGLRMFIGPAGCVGCHSGPLFTDFSFHDVGLESEGPDRADGIRALLQDPFAATGRYSAAPADRGYAFLDAGYEHNEGAFKTPSLRGVAETAPYGHAGQVADLEAMIEHYKEIGRRAREEHLDPQLARIQPHFDTAEVVAFLEALTSPSPTGEDARWLVNPFVDEP